MAELTGRLGKVAGVRPAVFVGQALTLNPKPNPDPKPKPHPNPKPEPKP